MVEWERCHRKHSNEEKPAKAVQGKIFVFGNTQMTVFLCFGGFIKIILSSQGSVFICFDTEESSKQFLERSDIKSFKDNEMLVLSR